MSEAAFQCRMCGHCCQGRGGIVLTQRDIERLCLHLGLAADEFLALHAEVRDGKHTIRSREDGFCVFYEQGCGVHPARPDICRAWPFFRGNLVDRLSWEMIQDYCPGVNAAAGFAEFVRQGLCYVTDEGLAQAGPDAPNALRFQDLLPDKKCTP